MKRPYSLAILFGVIAVSISAFYVAITSYESHSVLANVVWAAGLLLLLLVMIKAAIKAVRSK